MTKEYIDFNKESIDVDKQIKELNKKEGAYAFLNNKEVKILEAEYFDGPSIRMFAPGKIMMISEQDGISVLCNGGILNIFKIECENGKEFDKSNIEESKIEKG